MATAQGRQNQQDEIVLIRLHTPAVKSNLASACLVPYMRKIVVMKCLILTITIIIIIIIILIISMLSST